MGCGAGWRCVEEEEGGTRVNTDSLRNEMGPFEALLMIVKSQYRVKRI